MGREERNNRQTVNSGSFEAEFEELVSIGRHVRSIYIIRYSLETLLASAGWKRDECVSLVGSKVGLCPLAPECVKDQIHEYSDERVYTICNTPG